MSACDKGGVRVCDRELEHIKKDESKRGKEQKEGGRGIRSLVP